MLIWTTSILKVMKDDFEHQPFLHVLFYPVSRGFAHVVHWRKRRATKPIPVYSIFFDKFPTVARMRSGAKGWRGVEAIYTWENPGGLKGAIENFWMTARNCQALRNRLKIVQGLLRSHLKKLRRRGRKRINLLSLASGSGRSVFSVVKDAPDVHITAVDADHSSLKASRELAKQHGIKHGRWIHGSVFDLSQLPANYQADIIEVIGLHEYLTPDEVLTLGRSLKDLLAPDGVFITSHTHNNPESFIIAQITDWDMIYRDQTEFTNLIEAAGFRLENLHTEPHGIHSVGVFRPDKK